MNNDKLKAIAEKVINKLPSTQNDPEKFGSIVITLMVISIILTIIRVIQECEKNKIKMFNKQKKYEYFSDQIKTISIKKSWFTRMTIKKIVRKELSKNDYQEFGFYLTNAILDVGQNLNQNEIITLVEAAHV